MIRAIAIGVLLSAVLGASSWASAADTPTVLVRTTPLSRHELAETISGYGLVSADPVNTTSINFPHAGQIIRLLVNQGELVKKGTPLVEIDTSPGDAMIYSQAMSGVEFARKELARVKSMADKQLATQSQVEKASKDLADAEAALTAQQKLGTDAGSTQIKAPFEGIVSVVNAAPGDRIQPGAMVMQLARRDRLKVVIGIEPEEIPHVKPGMTVRLSSVFEDKLTVSGKVEKIYGMINPQTRLVDVTVKLEPKQAARLVPGIRVNGTIFIGREVGYAVPRRAVLKDAQGPHIFVVRSGKAYRIAVTPGIDSEGIVGISGQLTQGEKVVVLGNYQLHEGMAVREETQ